MNSRIRWFVGVFGTIIIVGVLSVNTYIATSKSIDIATVKVVDRLEQDMELLKNRVNAEVARSISKDAGHDEKLTASLDNIYKSINNMETRMDKVYEILLELAKEK